jgi:uncharacterized protein (DUF885 family)
MQNNDFTAPSRRTALALLAALATPAAGQLATPEAVADRAADAAAARMRALLKQSAEADAALEPLGEPGRPRDPVFVDPLSDSYATALLAARQRDKAAIAGMDRKLMGSVDRIAADVLTWRANDTIAMFDSGLFAIARQVPLNPSFGLQVELPDFVAGGGASFRTVADYEAGLKRLEGFTGFMDMTIVRLQEGLASGHIQPRIIVDNVLKQVDAMLALPVEQTPFYAAIAKMPPEIAAADRTRLTAAYAAIIRDKVLPAYGRWKRFLTDTYGPQALAAPGRSAMKDGDRLYAAELRHHTTTSMTAAEIHTLGLSEVARIRGEMEAVRPKLGWKGDLPSLFTHVRTDPKFYFKTEAELLARFAEIEARIWKGMPPLFRDRPLAPFRVAALPALGATRGTGYYKPGPPDGRTPGTLYFNMAMLNTRPIPTLETLTLHEGIPGHHFQITLARENRGLPALLRDGDITAYSEGWGLYSESLGRELGMFKDPWQWFGHLDMEMLRAARLVVDTGIHAQGWSRDRAMAYMADNTSMAPRDIEVEIDRYIAAPGQACAYKAGELTFQRLRQQATATLGDRFDIRDFHAQCLGTGALPLAVLEAKIKAWVARGGGR